MCEAYGHNWACTGFDGTLKRYKRDENGNEFLKMLQTANVKPLQRLTLDMVLSRSERHTLASYLSSRELSFA